MFNFYFSPFCIVSCTKKEEKFDSVPAFGYAYSFTFNPNIPGTLTTDYTYNPVPGDGYDANSVTFKNLSDATNHNYRYAIVTYLYHRYYNTSTKLNTSLGYLFTISFVPDSLLTTKTYTYATTSNSDLNVIGSLYAKDGYGNDYGWRVIPSAVYYPSYPNCQTNLTISNIYTRKLNDGQYVHTYADGSIDVTMLGNSITVLNGGGALENNPNYASQLHLKYNFHGVEITK